MNTKALVTAALLGLVAYMGLAGQAGAQECPGNASIEMRGVVWKSSDGRARVTVCTGSMFYEPGSRVPKPLVSIQTSTTPHRHIWSERTSRAGVSTLISSPLDPGTYDVCIERWVAGVRIDDCFYDFVVHGPPAPEPPAPVLGTLTKTSTSADGMTATFRFSGPGSACASQSCRIVSRWTDQGTPLLQYEAAFTGTSHTRNVRFLRRGFRHSVAVEVMETGAVASNSVEHVTPREPPAPPPEPPQPPEPEPPAPEPPDPEACPEEPRCDHLAIIPAMPRALSGDEGSPDHWLRISNLGDASITFTVTGLDEGGTKAGTYRRELPASRIVRVKMRSIEEAFDVAPEGWWRLVVTGSGPIEVVATMRQGAERWFVPVRAPATCTSAR